jgi:hypothetical protein
MPTTGLRKSLMSFIGSYVGLIVIMAGAMAASLVLFFAVLYIHHVGGARNKSPDK